MATASALPFRKFASLHALTRGDLDTLLDVAVTLWRSHGAGSPQRPLKGANFAVVFGTGARSHSATVAQAARDLGAQVVEIDLDRHDGAPSPKLLGRLYDAIDCEGVDTATVRAFDREAGVPVFDGLAADTHPAHVVAALLERALDDARTPVASHELHRYAVQAVLVSALR